MGAFAEEPHGEADVLGGDVRRIGSDEDDRGRACREAGGDTLGHTRAQIGPLLRPKAELRRERREEGRRLRRVVSDDGSDVANLSHALDGVEKEAARKLGRLARGERRSEARLRSARLGRLGHDDESHAPLPRQIHAQALDPLAAASISTQARSVSATDHACAGQPAGRKGGSPSKTSPSVPSP